MTRFGGTAAVMVGPLASRCTSCGGNADPRQRLHLSGGRRGEYSPGSALQESNGCLAWFTAVVNPYARPAEAAR